MHLISNDNIIIYYIVEVKILNVVKITQRDYGIDLLRIISMLMVPIVHIIGQGGILTAATPFLYNTNQHGC